MNPSIAIMPFLNMSGEQTQDFFCDGLSESLITALSKVPQLFVISRDSTFSYKGKAAKTVQVSEELGEMDQNYSMAYTGLSRAQVLDLYLGTSDSPKETLSRAMKSAQEAVRLDGPSAEAHAALSLVLVMLRQHDDAIEVAERAVTLNPNSAMALYTLALCLNYSYRSEDALRLVRQAIRLNPFVPRYYSHLGIACRETGRYEEGIAALKKCLQIAPNDVLANVVLVTLYAYSGDEYEARATVAEIQRIDPSYSAEKFARGSPWKEGPKKDRFIDALRKAGLR